MGLASQTPAPPDHRTICVPPETARIVGIGTAVPEHDIHNAFIDWAASRLGDAVNAKLFRRMAARSGIRHRYSVLPIGADGGSPVAPGGFYEDPVLPPTSARMKLYAEYAPALALKAIATLGEQTDLKGITHIVVASCTGFVAPGVDQIIARKMGLPDSVERLLVGFMGCYAAIAALRSARHIVRSDPAARVLVVTVEISTLHLQDDVEIEPLLAMLQFGDGAAAALITSDGGGLSIERPFAINLPESEHLIRWTIGDQGFAMHLSGEVPGRIADALRQSETRDILTGGQPATDIDAWAVHAGGRSILDAVEGGLGLGPDALDISRVVLEAYGNMSSATLMFALAESFANKPKSGVAIAFGPGLACEGFGYHWTEDA
jgi:predicted naringenin-chalcone synthase